MRLAIFCKYISIHGFVIDGTPHCINILHRLTDNIYIYIYIYNQFYHTSTIIISKLREPRPIMKHPYKSVLMSQKGDFLLILIEQVMTNLLK